MKKSNPYLIAVASFLVTVMAIAPQASGAATLEMAAATR